MRKPGSRRAKASYKEGDFEAEAAYADSIFRTALGGIEGAVAALEHALRWKPTYAPILSMGSVEYQRGKREEGQRLFHSLLSLSEDTTDLAEIIDEAGDFLIQRREYKDGLALYRDAVVKFPDVAALHEGLGCCAGHEGCYDEALAASERTLELEPGNSRFVNDLGWTLYLAGRFADAEKVLERAVSMDPSDALARENLRRCRMKLPKPRRKKSGQ